MNARTISAELVAAFKRLRLGGLLPTLAERLTMAEKQNTPLEGVLLMLLTHEISRRESTAATRRADDAALDPDMVLERWDKTAKVTHDRRVFNELVSLCFVEDHRNAGDLGPRGRREDLSGEWASGTSAAAPASTCAFSAPTSSCRRSSKVAWTTPETRS